MAETTGGRRAGDRRSGTSSQGRQRAQAHRRVGGDTGSVPVIDSTGEHGNPSGRHAGRVEYPPRVDKTVRISRDEIRRAAERESARARRGDTASLPADELSSRQRTRIPDSARSGRPTAQGTRPRVVRDEGRGQQRHRAGAPQRAREGQRRSSPSQAGHPQRAREPRDSRARRQERVPVIALVAAVVIALVVVISAVRCTSARTSGQQAAQSQQPQTQATQQEQPKATEVSGLPAGTYYIEFAGSDAGTLALDVSGVGDDAYTTVLANPLADTSGQKIQLDVSDDGSTCTLSNGSLYLDVGDVTAGSGRRLFANAATGGDSQKWELNRNSDGTYCIVSAAAEMAISVDDASEGALVMVQDYDGSSSSQRFDIVPEVEVESQLGTSGSSSASGAGSDGGEGTSNVSAAAPTD